MQWRISSKKFPLRYTWKISRNASDSKTNLFVEAAGEGCTGIGEAAPNIRYGETPDKLLEDFERIRNSLPARKMPLLQFSQLLDSFRLHNALRFAAESAYIHWLCRKEGKTVAEFFGLASPRPVATAFSLPIMPMGELPLFLESQRVSRFAFIKLKVNREEAAETVNYLMRNIAQPLLVDANESFTDPDEVIRFLEVVDTSRIALLEQPMPSGMNEQYAYLNQRTTVPLFADESLTDNCDMEALKKGFDGINMKLMKAGGYIRGLEQLQAARRQELQTMIGCMVETTLGISSALQFASLSDYIDLDGFLILREEPFELVQEKEGLLRLA